MRFKITFRTDRSLGDCLPINYQYEQSAVIYKILSNADKAYSAWLHDNGFQLNNGKHFKLFCYSRFQFEKYRILRDAQCIKIMEIGLNGMSVFCQRRVRKSLCMACLPISMW